MTSRTEATTGTCMWRGRSSATFCGVPCEGRFCPRHARVVQRRTLGARYRDAQQLVRERERAVLDAVAAQYEALATYAFHDACGRTHLAHEELVTATADCEAIRQQLLALAP